MSKQGSLSINSENIFPIIKKWLYSDHDIFYRELISNGCDAITKLKKLAMMGEYEMPEGYKGRVDVIVNAEDKTLTFKDNGLGMTAEEVEEYINQIAFSGATDFIAKYKDKANEDQIIGHFGLGFYSAFMVAKEVHIDTLSYKKDAKPVHWECDGGTEYEMGEGDKTGVGTTITLYLNDDCLEFCNEYKAREVIKKYCSFMPTEIYLSKAPDAGEQTIKLSEKLDTDVVKQAIKAEKEGEDDKLVIVKRPELLNETNPLWAKHPNECTPEDYKKFYRDVFNDYKEPLFWIHLNMDYPFNLKGILYFPKINMEYESIEGTIKLYNNQVFIADNIKEVIPEFLMLLKGVIDCPDLPLNVSRSALQNDGFVNKISEYITKKVADKLSGMCKTEKEEYEKYWEDISPFIKYGCLKDEKFCDKINDYILFKNLEDKYITLPELMVKEEEKKAEEENAEAENAENAEKDEANEDYHDDRKVIYYVTDENQQGQYIALFKEQGMDAVKLTHNIDSSFITQLERRNEHYRFMRIDSDVTDALTEETKDGELKEQTEKLSELFKKALSKENLNVSVAKMKNDAIASVITVSEDGRRMQDMMKMYGMGGMGYEEDYTLTLNAAHPLVKYITENPEGEHVNLFCEQLYDLAMIANKPLEPEAMSKFMARSNEIMLLLAK